MGYRSPVIIQQSPDKKKIDIVFEYDKNIIDAVKTISNCYWNNELRNWQIPNNYNSLIALVKLLDQAKFTYVLDPDIKNAYLDVLKSLKEKSETHKISSEIKKLDDVTDIPFDQFIKPGYDLLNFQKVCIKFIESSNEICLIGDEMGTGKTIQAIGYVAYKKWKNRNEEVKKSHRALVITLASIKDNWKYEIEKFTYCNARVLWSGETLDNSDYDFTIVNYEQLYARANTGDSKALHSLLELVKSGYFGIVFLDESHKIKNPKSKTTKAVLGDYIKIRGRIELSGTPAPNRTIELWPQLYFLDPIYWNSWFEFGRKFAAGHKTRFGWDMSGSSNLDKLYKAIEPYFIRRLKNDVLKELPKKFHKVVDVRLTDKQMREYEDIEFDFMTKFMLGDENTALAQIQALKQFTSRLKVDAAKEIIDNIIESGKKVIVFSQYTEIVDAIVNSYKDVSVRLVGKDVNPRNRQALVDKFQQDPSIKLFVSTVQAGGTGLTLTAADNVLFLDLPWTPGEMAQAEDRAHRKGQKDNVLVTILECFGTLDVKIREKIDEKRKILAKAIDGEDYGFAMGKDGNIFNDILSYYRSRQDSIDLMRKVRHARTFNKDPKAAKERLAKRTTKKEKT